MVDTLTNMEEDASRRAAAILAGCSPVPLQEGPKWIGRIASQRQSEEARHCYQLQADISGLLLAMRPANAQLTSIEPYKNGWLATSAPDDSGRYNGYVYVDSQNSVEMVGVLHVGPWLTESRTWWPGVYELQLLKELPTTVRQLISKLDVPAPPYLFMNLGDMRGTAIVTESDEGIERPFPIPADSSTMNFMPVLLDKLTYRESVVNSLNKIRRIIGLKSSRPFYL
ncbi:hypothetical protein K6Y76_16800 [Burkholderia cenocepacia]|jgi:hypothetical protein|uniref:hypothetical protein n=1 Tax=Burkholderia cenocepacia TaxID=95486 RepID=UPI0004F6B1BC|nr:hypothetical protein [Burkholderia cenocepacia]AIO43349.1 hypothetical protein DM42_6465 [Burkholderia cepacia]KGC05328.1 hypothetical protein DM44_7021 [Burkholderia cepacia]MCG0576823.1 hypothetical protein [Burkholderia cenocepacia]MCW3524470.1 hypothetical protein [Burkholderia cenocepacia]MCW3614692.1 hypothetical protein [Burkholderia cenocepacia]